MTSNYSRRRFIQSGVLGGAVVLSGCSEADTPFRDNEETISKPSFDDTIGNITVKKTPEGYGNGRKRFIILSDALVEDFGFGDYEQVRVRNQADPEVQWQRRPILYSTRTDPSFNSSNSEENSYTAWMSEDAMKRIGLGSQGEIKIDPFAPNPNIDSREEAKGLNEFVEQSINGKYEEEELIALAPHGGDIAKNTERQALLVASETTYSAWITAGYDDEDSAFERWFVSPNLINPDSFYQLEILLSNNEYEYAVSFVQIDETEHIVIGGLGDRELKQKYKEQIKKEVPDRFTVEVELSGEYDGTDTRNIVNSVTESGTNGVQVAQSSEALEDYWDSISEACLKAHTEYLDPNSD
jgi:hypothetical protein